MENESHRQPTPLFVAGCQSSGTTAFVDYLNEHTQVLVCQERYKRLLAQEISLELFAFDRILDYREGEADRKDRREDYVKRHADILAGKDPSTLRWAGDKNPDYVNHMGALAENNPGARFVVLYRSIEEVAESFESRSRDPNYHWFYGEDGFRRGIKAWNRALKSTQEFIQSHPATEILLVSYHDFFFYNEDCVPLISRFLDLEINEAIWESWKQSSERFERHRRRKEPLTQEQQTLVRRLADRETETWVLGRIEEQWRELTAGPSDKAQALASSRRWLAARTARERAESQTINGKLRKRCNQLERALEEEREITQSVRKKNRALVRQKDALSEKLAVIQNSRSWKLLNALSYRWRSMDRKR